LASPLPPWRFAVSGCAFEVFPWRPASEIRCRIRGSAPPSLDFPFRALVPGWAREPSSRGLGRLFIPTDVGQGVHSRSHFRDSFGRTVPPARSRSAFAVSHCLGDLLHLGFAGLLHPAAGRMFAAFHWFGIRDCSLGSPPCSPRRCSHPSKNSSSTAAPRHRGPCLHAVCFVCRGGRSGREPRCRSSRSILDTLGPRADRLPANVSEVGLRRLVRSPPGLRAVVGRYLRLPADTGWRLGDPFADPADQSGWFDGALAGFIASPTREGDARIGEDPYAVSLGCALAPRSPRSSLPRSSRSTSAGGVVEIGSSPSGCPAGKAVARAGALRRSGMARRPVVEIHPAAGQGRGLASSTCGARAPRGWLPHPRRSTWTRPTRIRESPPRPVRSSRPVSVPLVVAGALADFGVLLASRVSSAAGREARASRSTGSNPRRAVAARKRARWESSAARAVLSARDRGRLAPSSLARASPVPSWSLAPGGSHPRKRWLPVEFGASVLFRAEIGHDLAHPPTERPRACCQGRASVSKVSSRSPPGDPARETVRRCHRIAPMASIVGPQAASARSEDRPVRFLWFVARRSFV